MEVKDLGSPRTPSVFRLSGETAIAEVAGAFVRNPRTFGPFVRFSMWTAEGLALLGPGGQFGRRVPSACSGSLEKALAGDRVPVLPTHSLPGADQLGHLNQ